jgi:hypothetical protein
MNSGRHIPPSRGVQLPSLLLGSLALALLLRARRLSESFSWGRDAMETRHAVSVVEDEEASAWVVES